MSPDWWRGLGQVWAEVEVTSTMNVETTVNFRAFWKLGPNYIRRFCTKLYVLQNAKVILSHFFWYDHLLMGREHNVCTACCIITFLWRRAGFACNPLRKFLALWQRASPLQVGIVSGELPSWCCGSRTTDYLLSLPSESRTGWHSMRTALIRRRRAARRILIWVSSDKFAVMTKPKGKWKAGREGWREF